MLSPTSLADNTAVKLNEQLFPDRPGREELFHCAERWLEQDTPIFEPPAPSPSPDINPVIISSPLMAPMAIGYVLEGPVSRLLANRRASKQREHDDAILAAERHCRDMQSFSSIGELAAHIVRNERP